MSDTTQTACNIEEEKQATLEPAVKKVDKTSDTTEETTQEVGQATTGVSSLKELTPLEENDIKWRQSETKKNNAKIACWNALRPCICVVSTIISILLILLGVFWAYNISSISEPIGGIKVQINELNKYKDEEIKPRFKDWDSVYTQLKIKKIISP